MNKLFKYLNDKYLLDIFVIINFKNCVIFFFLSDSTALSQDLVEPIAKGTPETKQKREYLEKYRKLVNNK